MEEFVKRSIVVFFLFLSALALFGQEHIIAVCDFKVESDKPDYKYLGKGISRLVAGELRKSGKTTIVEREQMNEIIAEQKLSLTGLMDAGNQVLIGKMLAAEYLVVGEIIDMGAAGILVSVRMVNVETGAVVWQDEKQDKLAVYDFIGAYFAKSLLDSLSVSVSLETVAKIDRKEEKAPEAIIKTSEGIDAYDRKDTATAKKALDEAKTIDPGNEVAAEYLAKLSLNTAKFKVSLEPYYSDQNPGTLAFQGTDQLYLTLNLNTELIIEFFRTFTGGPVHYLILPDGTELWGADARIKLGYSFPIADQWGIRCEAFYFVSGDEARILIPNPTSGYHRVMQSGLGGLVEAGVRLNEFWSVGLGVAAFMECHTVAIFYSDWEDNLQPAFSFKAGAMFRNEDKSVVYDVQAGYCTGRMVPVIEGVYQDPLTLPLFVENTVTITLAGKNLFIILKQLNDICFDRPYYYGRIVPAAEYFFADWFSVRLGGEASYVHLNSSDDFGYGVMGGLTFRMDKLDLDLNFSYRLRPSRWLENIMYPEGVFTLGFSLNDLFTARAE